MIRYKEGDKCPECLANRDKDTKYEDVETLENHKNNCDCDYCVFRGVTCEVCGFDKAYADM